MNLSCFFKRFLLILSFSFFSFSSSFASPGEPTGQSQGSLIGSLLDQDFLADWNIAGTNTLRLENYGNNGDPNAETYPTEGNQFSNEFDLNFSRRKSLYETFRGQASGVINDSVYRLQDQGPVLERFNVTWEKGDSAVPFRLEAGDYFGYFSLRVLQRSLKGIQMEIQPNFGNADHLHSLIFLTGTPQSDYRSLNPADDLYTGFSWLVENTQFGNVFFNFVDNQRTRTTLPSRHQQVTSFRGEKEFVLGNQQLTLDGEFDYLEGDVETTPFGEDQHSPGGVLELSGQSDSPLTYRFRYERYGEHFVSNGGVVTQDHRAMEWHAGWKFPIGLRFQGRVQQFSDNLTAGNRLDTNTVGFKLLGAIFPGAPSGSAIDAFIQDKENQDKTTDTQTRSLNVNLPLFLSAGWTGAVANFIQTVQDKTTGTDTSTYQIAPTLTHSLNVFGFKGSIAPGMLFRWIKGGSAKSTDAGPTLGFGLRRDKHSFRLNYSLLYQDRKAGAANEFTDNTSLNYTYTQGNHTFGLEADIRERDTENTKYNRGTRIGFVYTYAFDKPERSERRIISEKLKFKPVETSQIQGPIDLADLSPGSDLQVIVEKLRTAGMTKGLEQPHLNIYETQIFDTIDERQRLVLYHDDNELKASAILIDFDDVGGTSTTLQTFERVRKELLDRYGRPSSTFEEGEFSDNFVEDVNSGRLIRLMEWTTPTGTIRFGIPRRLDGQVHMEVQHAQEFPSFKQTLWSIEERP